MYKCLPSVHNRFLFPTDHSQLQHRVIGSVGHLPAVSDKWLSLGLSPSVGSRKGMHLSHTLIWMEPALEQSHTWVEPALRKRNKFFTMRNLHISLSWMVAGISVRKGTTLPGLAYECLLPSQHCCRGKLCSCVRVNSPFPNRALGAWDTRSISQGWDKTSIGEYQHTL